MATYHMSVASGKKGTAVEHTDYIARRGRFGKNRNDLAAQGHGNMPPWAETPREFWKAADKFERANGAAYRTTVLALPRELDLAQQVELVEEFIEKDLGARPYQYAIHCPSASLEGGPQPHAHIDFHDGLDDGISRDAAQHFKRYNTAHPETGGCKKASGGLHPREMGEILRKRRAFWAELQNDHLERYGHSARVTHLSLQAQGQSDRQAQRHLGYAGVKELISTKLATND